MNRSRKRSVQSKEAYRIYIHLDILSEDSEDNTTTYQGIFAERFNLEGFVSKYIPHTNTWGAVYVTSPSLTATLFQYQNGRLTHADRALMQQFRYREILDVKAYGSAGYLNYYLKLSESPCC